jgi:hypothetical protein
MNFLETYMGAVKAGQFLSLTMDKPLKMRKGMPQVFKHSKLVVRAGVEYDNQKDVIAKRDNGELPKENAGLPWGEWEQYPYTISHNGGRYFRFSTAKGAPRFSPTFTINGVEIPKEVAEKMALASEFKDARDLDVFTLKEENLTSVKVGGEELFN